MRRVLVAALALSALVGCSPSSSAGVLESCADGGLPACYSNADCPASERCTTPANADPTLLITCCLPGQRGTGDAGSMCTGLDDCQTAVCAYTPSGLFCSAACTADSQCPAVLPTCVIVDAGSFCGLPP